MMNIALTINQTYTERTPFIKFVPMRYWPFKIKANITEFNIYQAGYMMEDVAMAVEQTALNSDKITTTHLALTVATTIYDDLLTKNF